MPMLALSCPAWPTEGPTNHQHRGKAVAGPLGRATITIDGDKLMTANRGLQAPADHPKVLAPLCYFLPLPRPYQIISRWAKAGVAQLLLTPQVHAVTCLHVYSVHVYRLGSWALALAVEYHGYTVVCNLCLCLCLKGYNGGGVVLINSI